MKLALLATTATALVLQASYSTATEPVEAATATAASASGINRFAASLDGLAQPSTDRRTPTEKTVLPPAHLLPSPQFELSVPVSASFARGQEPQDSCVDILAWAYEFHEAPKWKVYSQFRQDSILTSLFSDKWLGTSSKFFVEFGFNTGTWSADRKAGSGPNTQWLKFGKGWSGLLMDGGHENLTINLHKEFLTEENLGSVFQKYGVPENVDFVSIDVDSCDLYLFRALISSTPYQPKVVTVEYNPNYQCGESKTNKYKIGDESYFWQKDNLYGASLLALARVANEHGYTLAWVDNSDAFFVRKSLLCASRQPVPFDAFCGFTGRPLHERSNASEYSKWVVDYPGSSPNSWTVL
jgi:hypothetical protein